MPKVSDHDVGGSDAGKERHKRERMEAAARAWTARVIKWADQNGKGFEKARVDVDGRTPREP